MDNFQKRRLKSVIVLVIVLSLLGFIVYWFSTHSRLVIELSEPGSYTVNVLEQKSRTSYTENGVEDNWSKILPKGDYQIVIRGENSSFVSVISTGRFLKKTTVEASTQVNLPASAVGSGAQDCLHFDAMLVSYSCTGPSTSLYQHNPPTADSPSFNTSLVGSKIIKGIIVDSLKLIDSTLLLVQTSDSVEVVIISNNSTDTPSVEQQYTLPNIDPVESYQITSFMDGYLLYNTAASRAYFYSLGGTPTSYLLPVVDEPNLDSIELTGSEKLLAISYSNRDEIDREKGRTVVIVKGESTQNQYSFDYILQDINWCGENRLCALSGDSLLQIELNENSTYKMSQKLVGVGFYSVNNNESVVLAAMKDNSVLNYDFNQNNGRVLIAADKYTPTSIGFSLNGNSLINISGTTSTTTLLFGGSNTESKNVESVLESFEAADFIAAVSVFGNQLFISPEVGEVTYIESTGTYDFDPKKVADVNVKISELAVSSGAIENGYKIINVLN